MELVLSGTPDDGAIGTEARQPMCGHENYTFRPRLPRDIIRTRYLADEASPMFLFKKRPTVDADEAEWIGECWRWLDDILGPVDKEPKRQAILPSRRLFPDTENRAYFAANPRYADALKSAGT